MQTLKKIICAALAISMAAPLAACGGTTASVETTIAETTAADTTTAETTTLYANLPDADYDGETTKIFVAYNVEGGDTGVGTYKGEFAVDELNGDVINDARYSRNLKIEERFNTTIQCYDYNVETNQSCIHDPVVKALNTLIMSGDNDYAFMLLPGYSVSNMVLNGQMIDLYNVPNLDFDMPWWDQKANESLTVLNHLYYTTGDISTADNDATCTVLFNKVIAENYNIPNLYDEVTNGKWTTDLFYELCKGVSADVDGNNEWTSDDRYGAMVWDDCCMAVVNSAGVKCASVNSEGLIELTLNTEKAVTALENFVNFGRDTTQCFQYQRQGSASDTLALQMFSNNQTLFFMQLMQIVPKLRDMEADFGIIPFPKYDEAQDEYYNTVGSWHSVFFCIPMGSMDLEKSGVIAEALACEGMYTVTDAYYDVTLKTKAARDEESSAMLDIIFETRVYDLGWYYQFGMYNEAVMNMFRLSQKETDFASMYAKAESKAQASVDKVNEALAALD